MNNELKLLPPDDKMVTTKLENFDDKMLMLRGFKNRQELTEKMFLLMKQYGWSRFISKSSWVDHTRCL